MRLSALCVMTARTLQSGAKGIRSRRTQSQERCACLPRRALFFARLSTPSIGPTDYSEAQSATFLQRLPVEIGGFDILEGSALIRVRSC